MLKKPFLLAILFFISINSNAFAQTKSKFEVPTVYFGDTPSGGICSKNDSIFSFGTEGDHSDFVIASYAIQFGEGRPIVGPGSVLIGENKSAFQKINSGESFSIIFNVSYKTRIRIKVGANFFIE